MIEKFRQFWNRRTLKDSILRVLLLLFIIHLVGILPTEYVFRSPGGCRDVSELIQVTGVKKISYHGNFYLTSIYSENANVYLLLLGMLNSQAQLVPKEKNNHEELRQEEMDFMAHEMKMSKFFASISALRALGYDIKINKTPLTVYEITQWSKARGILEIGDEILEVEDETPENVDALRIVINSYRHRETLNMTVNRKGEIKTLQVPLTRKDKRTVVGIFTRSTIESTNLPPIINIDNENIIGSSAGLMFTLEIMRRVSGIDFSGGYKIAGTGAIDENGIIYPVDGVDLKVLSAESEKADYFLVPRYNYDIAVKTARKIKVIPVDNLQDALDFLKSINSTASVDDYEPTLKISDKMEPVKL